LSEQVFLGLGSNCDRESHLRAALQQLRETFGVVRTSPVYTSEHHDPLLSKLERQRYRYFNQVVEIDTDWPVAKLKERLCEIERCCGRIRGDTTSLACPLDIDILLYGQVVGEVDGVRLPHVDVGRRAYVLRPLSQLAPKLRHPQTQQSFADLWREFDASAQPLTEVAL
jgi:2-amino-4-hydroxy-6-hydroxymethyldihydropteridine diphosphokinase